VVLSETVVATANACQAAIPLISLLAYIPQWAKVLRTKSSGSVSTRSWLAWTVSSGFALFYAVTQLILNGRGWALVFSTSLGLAFVVCTLFLVVRFRHGPIHGGDDSDRCGRQRQNQASHATSEPAPGAASSAREG
jgi:uncharacterized protein with PQ loop repeat